MCPFFDWARREKPDFVAFEQHMQHFNILASLGSSAGQIETYLVPKVKDRFSRDKPQIYLRWLCCTSSSDSEKKDEFFM